MANQEVTIRIDGKDDSAPAFASAARNLESVAQNAAEIGKKLAVAGGAITALAVVTANSAAEFETLRSSFTRLADNVGENSDLMLEQLKKVSNGTISNKDLVLGANRALSFGVAKNTEEMTKLLEIARLKSRDMGITMTQAFNDIVTGLGRGSPLILDNLGITVKLGEANEEYAKSIGKTVNELTEQERKLALVQAVLKSGNEDLERAGDLQETNAEKVQKFKAQLADLQVEMGAKLIPILTLVTEKLSGVVTQVVEWMDKNPQLASTLLITIAALGGLMLAISPILIALPGLVVGIKAVGAALAFLAANPIVLLVAALVALGALLYKIFVTDWEQTKDTFLWLWDGLKTAVADAMTFVSDFIMGKWEDIKKSVLGAVEYIIAQVERVKNALSGVGSNVSTAFRNLPANLGIGGSRATGGPVSSGVPYLVGEKGPEIFTPHGSGNIGAAGGITIHMESPVFLDQFAADKFSQMIMDRLKLSLRATS